MTLSDSENTRALYKVIDTITYRASQKFSSEHKKDCYPYIPSNTEDVIESLLRVRAYLGKERMSKGVRFLDAGTGIGIIPLIAKSLGFCAEGMEINEVVVDWARDFMGINQKGLPLVFKGNLLTFNKFRNYDVIYYYHPLSLWQAEERFETRLENQMKVGSIAICNLKAIDFTRRDPRFIDLRIWPFTTIEKVRQTPNPLEFPLELCNMRGTNNCKPYGHHTFERGCYLSREELSKRK